MEKAEYDVRVCIFSLCERVSLRLLLAALLFLFSTNLFSQSLQKMDEILARAGSVENFLQDSSLRDEYYQSTRTYLHLTEVEFPKTNFDFILDQVSKVGHGVPGFTARLWETTNIGNEHGVDVPIKSEGLIVNRGSWIRFVTELKERLRKEAHGLVTMSSEDREKEIHLRVSQLTQRIEEHRIATAEQKKRDRVRADAEFFASLKTESHWKATAAAILLNQLDQPKIHDLLESSSADILLHTIQSLRDQTLDASIKAPSELVSFIKDLLPNKDDLLQNSALFYSDIYRAHSGNTIELGALRQGRYIFRPFPRRFHGIWKGIPAGECVGGACSFINDTTPERWATVALKDTNLFAVEKEGGYLGFVQIVPVVRNADGAIFGSIDFGSRIFSRQIIFIDTNNDRAEREREREREREYTFAAILRCMVRSVSSCDA